MKDARKHKILFHSLNLDMDLTNSSLAKFAYLLDGMESSRSGEFANNANSPFTSAVRLTVIRNKNKRN